MNYQRIPYQGWDGCVRLSNPHIELVATAAIGPRLIRFGRPGGPNQLGELPDQAGQTGGTDFKLYGGHRLWVAPEAQPRSYYPDNQPVQVEEHPGFVRLIPPLETSLGIQKEIDLSLAADAPEAVIVHRLKNASLWALEMAPWALTLMALGGVGILPLPPRGSHAGGDLLPVANLALWSYTDLSDPRYCLTPQAILLRHAGGQAQPQKIGLSNRRGWVAYYQAAPDKRGDLFIKRFDPVAGAVYPDQGCACEAFTRFDMFELETLGPLSLVPPGGQLEYTERWSLASGFSDPSASPAALQKILDFVQG